MPNCFCTLTFDMLPSLKLDIASFVPNLCLKPNKNSFGKSLPNNPNQAFIRVLRLPVQASFEQYDFWQVLIHWFNTVHNSLCYRVLMIALFTSLFGFIVSAIIMYRLGICQHCHCGLPYHNIYVNGRFEHPSVFLYLPVFFHTLVSLPFFFIQQFR